MQECKQLKTFLTIGAAASLVLSCSVISRDIRSEALPEMPFDQLVENAEENEGQTVLLGGYILENETTVSGTELKVLQAPLDFMDEPMFKDLTQGRFVVYHQEYLDPEVFKKGRSITVAGTILPCKEKDCLNRI